MTTDKAREALLATVLDPDAYDTEIRQRIDALEATIRAEYADALMEALTRLGDALISELRAVLDVTEDE